MGNAARAGFFYESRVKEKMPILFKKMVAGALIAGSVTFAVLIISSNSPSPNASATSLADLGQIDPLQPETIPDTSAIATKNLTDISSGAISAVGLQSPEEMAADYLAEAAKDFDYNSLKMAASVDRLKIIPTSDPRLVSIYIKGLNDALSPVFSDLKLGKDTQANLKIMSAAYDQAINTLYMMPAPQMFNHPHQNVIANLGGQKAATEMILQNLESDPLRALLGLQAITIFNDELMTVQKTIIDLAGQN